MKGKKFITVVVCLYRGKLLQQIGVSKEKFFTPFDFLVNMAFIFFVCVQKHVL